MACVTATLGRSEAPAGSEPTMSEPEPTTPHYRQPGWFTKNVFNRPVAVLTRAGISVWGSRVLESEGAQSGRVAQRSR